MSEPDPEARGLGYCLGCRFFCEDDDNELSGDCRINPPTMTDDDSRGCWPTVVYDEWCGQWQSATTKAVVQATEGVVFDPNSGVEDIHFTDLELPSRIVNSLTHQVNAAQLTAKRLCEMDAQTLLRIDFFGKKSLFELHEGLVAKGFKPHWNAKEPILRERIARSQYNKFQSQCGYEFERPTWDLCKTFAAHAESANRGAYDLSEIKQMLEVNRLPLLANSHGPYLRRAVVAWEAYQAKYGRNA